MLLQFAFPLLLSPFMPSPEAGFPDTEISKIPALTSESSEPSEIGEQLGTLLEMQTLRPHPRPTESESAF